MFCGTGPKLYAVEDVGRMMGLVCDLGFGVTCVGRVARVASKLDGRGGVGGCRRGDLCLSVKA